MVTHLRTLCDTFDQQCSRSYAIGPGEHMQRSLGYTQDADWASDKNRPEEYFWGSWNVLWRTILWLQRSRISVATSSAESEYMSQAMYAKQGQWTAADISGPWHVRIHQQEWPDGTDVRRQSGSDCTRILTCEPHENSPTVFYRRIDTKLRSKFLI